MIEYTSDFVAEPYRITKGPLASSSKHKLNGAFSITLYKTEKAMRIAMCVSDDGKETGWEHVSIHINNCILTKNGIENISEVPNYKDILIIKNIFWKENETVFHYFPSKELHINIHPYTLHLWKPKKTKIPMPPKELV